MLPRPLLQRWFGGFFPVVFKQGINTTKEILILFVYRAPTTFTARVRGSPIVQLREMQVIFSAKFPYGFITEIFRVCNICFQ